MVVDIKKDEQVQYAILALKDFAKNITFNIIGKNAQLEVIVICLQRSNQKADIKIVQHHKNQYGTSTNLIKTILKDSATFNFNGLIKIDKDARQTNAFLTQNTLTLSENTTNHSVPSLEINADDVKASHSATTSFVDEKELYYLKSRGINQQNSGNLILEGFINSAVEKIVDETIKRKIEKEVKKYFN